MDNQILANALKAIVGALIKSSGEEQTAHFVRDFVITQLQGNIQIYKDKNMRFFLTTIFTKLVYVY